MSPSSNSPVPTERSLRIAERVEAFVREVVIPYERDPRRTSHGPDEELVHEMRARAREAGVLTPHILADGGHLSQLETALVLKRSGLSPLGPIAVNTAAPDEGNMYLLGKIGTPAQKDRFLAPLVRGDARSAFFMTEPAEEGGAGSDPSMLQTIAQRRQNGRWRIDGRKAFITGAEGASVGIVMAKVRSMNMTSSMANNELMKPSEKMSSESVRLISGKLPLMNSRIREALGRSMEDLR